MATTLASVVAQQKNTGVLILSITKQLTIYKYYQDKMQIQSQNLPEDADMVHI